MSEGLPGTTGRHIGTYFRHSHGFQFSGPAWIPRYCPRTDAAFSIPHNALRQFLTKMVEV
jgi:hypothetical protein